MKAKKIILWVLVAVCIVVTVILNRSMVNSEPEFEEVQVTVLSSKDVNVVNKKTGTTSATFHEVEVTYNGKTYKLENAHDSYTYREGSRVKAYLANDRLFANEEGVKTSTPLAIVYFIFLFGTFILFFVAAVYTGKRQKKPEA